MHNFAWHRHHFSWLAAHFHGERPCRISAWLVEDFFRKGKKSVRKGTNYAYIVMEATYNILLSQLHMAKAHVIFQPDWLTFFENSLIKIKKILIIVYNKNLVTN